MLKIARIAKRVKNPEVRVAIAQICSSSDPWANLFQVHSFYEEARGRKCGLLAFPENIFYRGPKSSRPSDLILSENFWQNPRTDFELELARFMLESEMAILLGSTLTSAGDALPRNRSWFFSPHAESVSFYDKIHLFQFDDPRGGYDETQSIEPGRQPVSVTYDQWNFGLSICYDFRFPELYRRLTVLMNSRVLFVPSAFTRETGEAHWHSLLRARAIENQAYVFAPAQWGSHEDDNGVPRFCYGHSLAIDPWGRILGDLTDKDDGILTIDLDHASVDASRRILPALKNIKLPL